MWCYGQLCCGQYIKKESILREGFCFKYYAGRFKSFIDAKERYKGLNNSQAENKEDKRGGAGKREESGASEKLSFIASVLRACTRYVIFISVYIEYS